MSCLSCVCVGCDVVYLCRCWFNETADATSYIYHTVDVYLTFSQTCILVQSWFWSWQLLVQHIWVEFEWLGNILHVIPSWYHLWCMPHTLMFLTVPNWFPQILTYIWYASMCLDFELSDAQYGQAIEHLVPSLSYLRTELCSTNMSEACFWKIYFVLLHSKLNKQDAEILSTLQVYSFPLFYFLCICGIFLS
jgi:hypothetical protein